MITYRSDSGGTCHNERTDLLKKLVEYHEELTTKINILNDHKGYLYVHWRVVPLESEKEIICKIWECFNEYSIEHLYYNKVI